MRLSHKQLHQRRDFDVEGKRDVLDRDLDQDNHKRGDVVVQTVYKTMEPTFTGKVAGYTTLGKDPEPKPTESHAAVAGPETKTAEHKPHLTQTVDNDKDHDDHAKIATDTDMATVIGRPKHTTSLGSEILQVTDLPQKPSSTSALHTAAPTTELAQLTSASATSGASSDKSESGTSAGAKAGIAFGVMGGLLIVGLLVFFVFTRRKKRAQQDRLDDEKSNNAAVGAAPAPILGVSNTSQSSNTRAPRVSLRPVTQFFPNWNLDKRNSKGAAMALTPTATVGAARRDPERPSTSQSTHPSNPFGNQAERVPSPNHAQQASREVPGANPFEPTPAQDPFNAAATSASPAGLARKASMRKDGQQPPFAILTPIPGSPASAEMVQRSGSPANGPGPANVHRVQLDFKPTLDDEMELRAGELVRLLHEYDDGWALCVRMDRSQQGVVPRTCLSTRAVKPRPANGGSRPGPPVNPNGPPRGQPQGPGPFPPAQRPNQGAPRSQSPAGRPMGGPGARSQSPAGRSMSPAPRSQSPSGRPSSPSGVNPRMNAPGPSPMNPAPAPRSGPPSRKPVPGQAM